MKTKLLAFTAIASLFLGSCTEAFKHKMEVADKYLDDMNATNVTVGTATETNNGESMTMTTLSFTGCSSHIEDIEREWTANQVAKEFIAAMTDKDLEGETHLKIYAETKGDTKFEYLFELDDLKKTDAYMKMADDAVKACIADDQDAIDKMKDDAMMPDDAMGEIFYVTHYNDSLYEGQSLSTEMLGYRFANGADDPDLELFSVDYDVTGESAHTTYTINIDRNTNKVVYIWLKTDPY